VDLGRRGKSLEKLPLGRPKMRREFNYKLGLRDIGRAERQGRVVCASASYSVGPGIQISVRRPAIVTEVLWFSSVPPGKCRYNILN
jgi:hypothetical protein